MEKKVSLRRQTFFYGAESEKVKFSRQVGTVAMGKRLLALPLHCHAMAQWTFIDQVRTGKAE